MPLDSINHIICIASGKGGVGKSSTAVNLAIALAKTGKKVGILDADIYGPSLPLMLGIGAETRPQIVDKRFMIPVEAHGVVCNSMGLLVDAKTAMVWRAPMIISAFNQILNDTQWGDLDVLIVDMPPGTGDIQLSLAQSVKVAGAVIVTTPQDVALLDARKGVEMFAKVEVPILGIVQNMAVHVCSQCGHAEHVFGQDGALTMAQEYNVDVLANLPLSMAVRVAADAGQSIVEVAPDGPEARALFDAADAVIARLASAEPVKMPTISMGDD